MKIGITSQNFRTITGHAGKARRFLLYETQGDGSVREVGRLDLPKELSMHEFRGDAHPTDGLDLIVTAGCGKGFIQRLASRGIRVITTALDDPAEAARTLAAGGELPAAVPHDHDPEHHHVQGQGQPVKLQP